MYLGVRFNYNGNFKKAISKQVTQARKALSYIMLVKAKKLQLSVDTQCHLFDHLVLPVLLYGSEVWGYEQIEVFHRKFLRKFLLVNKCTPDCMVHRRRSRGDGGGGDVSPPPSNFSGGGIVPPPPRFLKA